jgi:hypothetical protein
MTNIELIAFEAPHITQIDMEPEHAAKDHAVVTPEYANALAASLAVTILADGRKVGCVGAVTVSEGLKHVWAHLGRIAGDECEGIMTALHSRLNAPDFTAGVRRVQLTVPTFDARGCLFAKAMGFEVEGRMEKYGPDGADHHLFARVA